jgi:hypothetical protein
MKVHKKGRKMKNAAYEEDGDPESSGKHPFLPISF